MGFLQDMVAFYSDAVLQQGQNSRPANVWKGLQDKLLLVQSAADFIEAFHDEEASASTLAGRAQALRDIGVQLPQQVNRVLSKKELAAFVNDDDFKTFMKYLDPAMKDNFPTGIASLMNETMDPQKPDSMAPVFEFQMATVVQTVNNLLLSVKAKSKTSEAGEASNGSKLSEELSSDCDSGKAAVTEDDLRAALDRLVQFLAEFKNSHIYGEKSLESSQGLKAELHRFELLVDLTMSSKALDEETCETLQSTRAVLLKKQGPFNKGLTLFPVGIFLSELAAKKTQQFRADLLLEIDLAAAAQIAAELKVMNVDTLLKDKQGEMELIIPSQPKICDMVAKWQATVDGASTSLKAKCTDHMETVDSKVRELKAGLLSVVAYKTKQFEAMEKLIGRLCKGEGFQDGEAVECSRLMSALDAMQPLQKVPLVKLLGKDYAQDLENTLLPALSFFKQLHGAFSHVVKLSQVSVKEGAIMAREIIDLYASLHNNDLLTKIDTVAPWFHTGWNNLRSFLEKVAKDWISTTCSDFANFAAKIMVPDANFQEVVQSIPAGAEAADVDFSFIYISFAAVLKGSDALVRMPQPQPSQLGDAPPIEAKDAMVHCSFLCLCGVLVQMTRHATVFNGLLQKVDACKAFSAVLEDYVKALQAKNVQFVFETKAALLAEAVPVLEKLQGTFAQHNAILNVLAQSDNLQHGTIQDYYSKLEAYIKSCFSKTIVLGHGDLQDMISSGQAMFKDVRSRHQVPALFQADPLNKQSVQSLFQDPKVQMLALFAPKAKDFLTSTGTWVKVIRSLPVGKADSVTAMTSECQQLAAAVSKDAQFFQRVDANDENPSLWSLTEFQMSVTMAQALTRDLQAGETRVGLVNRCFSIVRSQELPLDKVLKQRACAMLRGK